MSSVTDREIRDVKRRWSARLLRRPGVVGLGVEYDILGRPQLTVFLEQSSAQLGLPLEIEGHPLKFRVSGRVWEQLLAQ